MKNLLLLLAVCLSISASAQKIHFTDAGNQWVVYSINNGPPTTHGLQNYSFQPDTTIGTHVYKPMNIVWPYAPYPGCSSGSCPAYVREDTIQNKVFVLLNDTERILMDYNLIVGDSFTHIDGNHIVYIDTVSETTSTTINGIAHKVWYFRQVYSNSIYASMYSQYSVIEGIGCLYKPLFLSTPIWGLDEYNLVCFYHNSAKPVVSPSIPEFWGGVYFDNQSSCTLDINASRKTLYKNEVYPNPIATNITISSTTKITSLTITNLLGQTMYTHDHNTEKVEIDVSHFPPGIYLIRINNSEIRKFVKN